MADTQAKFLDGSLFQHVAVMSFTASIGLMAVFFVDFVDMVFISMLGHAELAAAVGYAGSVLFFTTSLSIGVSIAAGALVARSLGRGETDVARRQATNTIAVGVLISIVFIAVVWMNLTTLTGWIGASGETQALAVGYLQIIVPSMPFMLAGMVGSAVLRAHGDAKRSMWVTIFGGLINAVLDPILIFGFDLELTGAAIASVVARLTMAAFGLGYVMKYYGGFTRLSLPAISVDFRPMMVIAVPAILTQLATPVGAAFVTRVMAGFGEEAVAGMAIVGRLTPLSFAVIFALSGAVGPIIGQNNGAGLQDRVRGAFRDALLFTLVMVVAVAVILFLLRAHIVTLFQATGLSQELIYLFCGPLALAFFFNGVIFVANSAFNNLGHPFYSTWINWGRNTLGTIPLVYIGAHWYGAAGVLIGQAAGGILFSVLAYLLALRVIGKNEKAPTPPKTFQRQARLQSLFNHRR